MKAFLTKFSRLVIALKWRQRLIPSFRNRYYRADSGKQSQQFLLSTLKSIATSHSGVTIKEFPHPWGQNSIIAHFAPANTSFKNEAAVVIGAHQDSTNQFPFLPAPFVTLRFGSLANNQRRR